MFANTITATANDIGDSTRSETANEAPSEATSSADPVTFPGTSHHPDRHRQSRRVDVLTP